MPLRVRIARGLAATSVVVALIGLAERIEPQLAATGKYPEPRFPAYLKPPRTVDDVMPAAREIVRNKNGIQGAGMGVLQKGDGVLLVPTIEAEPMILDAIGKALAERGVKVDVKYNYELVGVPREDAAALLKQRESFTSEDGYMEAVGWIENQFADPEVPKKWLKERRPELYAKLFPRSREMTPHTKQVWEKLKRDSVGPGIVAYLGKHPELRGAYWGKGGSTGLRRALNPVPQKFLGILWQDNRYEVMSQIGSFPADVWQLSEEKTLEPLAHVDQIRVTDPEGTDITADVNEVQAQRWAQGSYQRGHLYMFPNQATGRFGYSVVDYPAFQKQWLAREPIVRASGVIAGTHNHVGMYPRWEVRFKDGYIVDVKGGGTYGDILREFLQYPGTQDLVYPFHKNPGFWYLYEAAFGTHPKYFRNPKELMEGSLGPDRLHAGVIHWGLGIRLWHDPDGPVESKQWMDFTAKHNVPRDHSFHTHTYFSSYRVRIRGANQWVDILDKGRMTSLDDAETKALASRYGDPTRILADDWIIDMPGVSAPGSYEQYSRDPWTYEKAVVDKAMAGTYEYYYPRPGAAAAAKAGGE